MWRSALSRPRATDFPQIRTKKPRVLAFDTSGPFIAVAIAVEDQTAGQVEEMARGQAEALFSRLERLLSNAGWGWAELDAIGVGTGPGNFTGLRIAVSAARGLGVSLGIPVFGVSAFETAARLAAGTDRLLVSLPAPRGAVYVQVFNGPTAAGKPQHIDPVAGLDGLRTARPERVFGHRGEEIGRALGIPGFEGPMRPDPKLLAEIVAESYLCATEAPPRPAPLYIRSADAAPPREAPPVILP